MRYQILMDSCGDLSEEMREREEIVSVPLRIRIGNEEMYDDESLDSRELLKKMQAETGMVGSSCPSPSQYAGCRDKEAERIYVLTGSSVLSGSHMSGRLAAEIMREEAEKEGHKQHICVVDSRSASAGQTLLAMNIIQWEKEGKSFQDIKKRLKQTVQHMETRFVLENLDMLEKSGRLVGLKARLAEALNICPILRANREGAISQCGQARGIKKALSLLQKQIMKEISAGVSGPVIVSHCHCPERAFFLKIAIHEKFPDVPVRIVPTRGISSMYAGKGGIVVAYAVTE